MLAKDELFLVTDGVELTQGLAWLSTGGHWVHGRSSPGEWRQSTGCHVEFIWFWVDGSVFVETLIDLEDFFFCNFLFSDLSVLISDYNGLQQPDQTSSCSTSQGIPFLLDQLPDNIYLSLLHHLDLNICFNMELTISCMVSTSSPYLSTKQFFNLSTVLTSPISWLLSTSSTLSTLYQFLPTTLNFITSCSTKLHLSKFNLHLPWPLI